MAGYWNNPLETAEVLRDATTTATAWLHTGDLGYLDEDGYVFIVDRKKDLIKTSGFQVWPREIEEVISAHPAVPEVGVAGVPDRQGRSVKAWVVLQRGADGHRGRAARVLPRAARAVQGARARRVPHGAAEDDGRQGPAPRARGQRARGVVGSYASGPAGIRGCAAARAQRPPRVHPLRITRLTYLGTGMAGS